MRLRNQTRQRLLLAGAVWTLTGAGSPAPAFAWPHPGQLFRVDGSGSGMGLGSALSQTGDVDGDGQEDGAMVAEASGEVRVVLNLFDPAYADASGGSGAGRSVAEGSIRIDTGLLGLPLQAALGDLDDDGRAEVILGIPGYGQGGAVAIFYGLSASEPDLTLAGARYVLEGDAGSALGSALAFRRSSSGSVEALLVGAPGAGSGALYSLRQGDLDPQAEQVFPLSNLGLSPLVAQEPGARLGSAVVEAGDLDLDGQPDVAVSAPGTAAGGQVHVLLSSQGLSSLLADEYLTYVANLPGALAGTALAGGLDLSGDGLPDLVIGAPGDGGETGRIYIVTPMDNASSSVSLTDVPAALAEEVPGVGLGAGLSIVPDVNADGMGELLVGVPAFDQEAGAVALLLGGPFSSLPAFLSDATWVYAGQAGDSLGHALGLHSASYPGLVWLSSPTGEAGGQVGAGHVEAVDVAALFSDADGDGVSIHAGDCDDRSDQRAPGLLEACDGLDNDCDQQTPGDELDSDSDGYFPCEGDCDDADGAILPGQNEVCNGQDDNCDGSVLPTEQDGDGDGVATCQGDCDDSDAAIFPGAVERCNGLDDDCDQGGLQGEADADADGYRLCAQTGLPDCDDSKNQVFPGAEETCDGLDTDCSGQPGPTEVDADHDGVLLCTGSTPGDCDDSNPGVSPQNAETCDGLDTDCDGSLSQEETDQDGDGIPACSWTEAPGDCNDANPEAYPGAEERCDGIDNSCDASIPSQEADLDGDGYLGCATLNTAADCNDDNPDIHPDAAEACDGQDSNCDGFSDADLDGDGFFSCSSGTGATDCDDGQTATYPGAPEACDGEDNNCDGITPATEQDADLDGARACDGDCNDASALQSPLIEERCDGLDNNCDLQIPPAEQDVDGDGFPGCSTDTTPADCNDANASVYPGAKESCDGDDDDCDGIIDDGVQKTFYSDQDGDGYGDPNAPAYACSQPPSGTVANKADCNDTNPNINPDAVEICDGLDTNCDTIISANETLDADGDGFSQCLGDCNDSDSAISPDAAEVMDGVDNNCDQVIDDVTCIDTDEDGFPAAACQGSTLLDCNDSASDIYPGASEGQMPPGVDWIQGDGLDNDCDGTIDEDTDRTDDDGDGLTELEGDCDDSDPDVHPGQEELPGDGIDNNCSTEVDEDPPSLDSDGDGFAELASDGSVVDCDDNNFFIHPGQAEDPGTPYDDNCDGILTVPPVDADQDGSPIDTDCDDQNPAIHPGALEVADEVDNNCDGKVDEGIPDGPGIGCGALTQSTGVNVACSVSPSDPQGRSSLWSLLGLLGLAGAGARRRRPTQRPVTPLIGKPTSQQNSPQPGIELL